MSALKSDLQIAPQEVFGTSSIQNTDLGAMATTGDGRYFRYVKCNGTTALSVGKLVMGSNEEVSVQNIAIAAASAGATSITTTGSLTVSANQFAGGWALITVTPGVGYQYKIKNHPAASGTTVVFTLEDPIQVALTTSSKLDVVANPYNNVLLADTSLTSAPLGVAVSTIGLNCYGWVQVKGIANCLANGAITVGQQVYRSIAVAGAVTVSNGGSTSIIGQALTGIADTEYGAINLNLV